MNKSTTVTDPTDPSALDAAVAARDRQLSIATHELRTPISSILLNLQLLQRTARRDGSLDAATVERMLAGPVRQLKRLTHMVDLLLDAAQVERERLVLSRQPVDLCELVHEVAGRLDKLAAERGARLHLHGCDPVHGEWDRLRLEQVVTNLLTNGIKYGGGDVEVRTLCRDGACIEVADRGQGIAEEDRERIFEPYRRLATGSSEEGAGLGLYIVREIVHAHGGRIVVEDRPGGGTLFRVHLPQ